MNIYFDQILGFISHYNLVAAAALIFIGWRVGIALQKISDNHLAHIQKSMEDTLDTARLTKIVMEQMTVDSRRAAADIAVIAADLRRHQAVDEQRYSEISMNMSLMATALTKLAAH